MSINDNSIIVFVDLYFECIFNIPVIGMITESKARILTFLALGRQHGENSECLLLSKEYLWT